MKLLCTLHLMFEASETISFVVGQHTTVEFVYCIIMVNLQLDVIDFSVGNMSLTTIFCLDYAILQI